MGVSREAIKTENKAWIPGASDVVCQRHFTDSDYRPIKPCIRRVTLIYISQNINALFWLAVMYIDKLLVDFNEIKRNVIIGLYLRASHPMA